MVVLIWFLAPFVTAETYKVKDLNVDGVILENDTKAIVERQVKEGVADDLQKTDKANSIAERTIRTVLSEALNNVSNKVKKSDGRKRRRSKKRRSKKRM